MSGLLLLAVMRVPMYLFEHHLACDLVENDIPVLLSRKSMANAEMCLNFKDDTLIRL